MKHMKRLASYCAALVGAVALMACLSGCTTEETYVPADLTPTIESPVIGEDGVLRVGVDTSKAPLAGEPTGSTEIVGIDVDIAAALADLLGLKLEIIDVSDDPEGALNAGTVDIVMGISTSETSYSFWTSSAYIPTGIVLFASSSDVAVPTGSDAPSIAVQVSSTSSWAVTNTFDQGVITTTDDLQGAFSMLESGEVDYVAADALVGTYVANSSGITAEIIALMQTSEGYGIGVLDSNTDLKQVISESIAALESEGIISVIEEKWLGVALDVSGISVVDGASVSDTSAEDDSSADEDAE